MEQKDTLHGSIFVLLKRFVLSNYDFSTWVTLLEHAGIKRESYEMHEVYPEQEMYALVNSAAELTGIDKYAILEKFGYFCVPDLIMVYNKYIDPNWKTFEMLLHTESNMHAAVRAEDRRTTPPILNVTRVDDKTLIIDYHSKRKMASLALGIIKGIAAYYKEEDIIKVIPITPLDAERVQIRVEFI